MEATFIARTAADGKVSGQFFHAWSENTVQFLRQNRFQKVYFEGKWGDMSEILAQVSGASGGF